MKIELDTQSRWYAHIGLNPYSNGMKIEQFVDEDVVEGLDCLNPYSNGMKIEPPHAFRQISHILVLILILME